jgi:PAS domain S-box-containing protein
MKGNHQKPPNPDSLPNDNGSDPQDPISELDNADRRNLSKIDITLSGSFDVTSLQDTHLGKVLQIIPIPALFLDSNNRMVYLNRSSRTLTGENFNALGMSFLVFFPEPSSRSVVESAIGRVFSTRASQVIESIVCSEYATVYARIHLRSVRREIGRFILVMIEDLSAEKKLLEIMEDNHDRLESLVRERTLELETTNNKLRSEITLRKTTEKHLEASDILFETVIQCIGDGIFVKDSTHKYVHANPALERLFGVIPNSLIGKSDSEVFCSREASAIEELEQRVLGGDVVDTEKAVIINGVISVLNEVRAPLRDGEGKVVGVCGVVRDVTERKMDCNTPQHAPEEATASASMREAIDLALTVAKTDSTILLLGETGCGKDYLARFIHQNSNRILGPFITLNCAAIPIDLMESELFGHELGAFTSAVRHKRGQVELAEGGTLVLNEIGELPLSLQAKLLSFLDHRVFSRVGGEKDRRANIRLITATNKDLAAEVAAGRFRMDLFHRINVFPVTIPPLRKRVEDIPLLSRQILEELCSYLGIPEIPTLAPSIELALKHYSWPGNVRELRNVLERSLILKPSNSTSLSITGLPGTNVLPKGPVNLLGNKTLNQIVRDVKSSLIQEALSRSKGNKKRAAQILGIPYVSLRHHLQNLSNDKKYDEGDEA